MQPAHSAGCAQRLPGHWAQPAPGQPAQGAICCPDSCYQSRCHQCPGGLCVDLIVHGLILCFGLRCCEEAVEARIDAGGAAGLSPVDKTESLVWCPFNAAILYCVRMIYHIRLGFGRGGSKTSLVKTNLTVNCDFNSVNDRFTKVNRFLSFVGIE